MAKMMVTTDPQQQCQLCKRIVFVKPDGRGFPPDIAKRRLKKACNANNCPCEPKYTPGVSFRMESQ